MGPEERRAAAGSRARGRREDQYEALLSRASQLVARGLGDLGAGGSPGSVVRGVVGEPEQHRYIYMSWALGGEMGRCCSGLPEDIYI